jgi:hypothetical protein
LLWTGLFNIALTLGLLFAAHQGLFEPVAARLRAEPAKGPAPGQPVVAQSLRTDLPAKHLPPVGAGSGKRSLAFSVVARTSDQSFKNEPLEAATDEEAFESVDVAPDGARYAEPLTRNPIRGAARMPSLRRNPRTGEPEIGNFAQMTLPDEEGDCLEIGRTLLEDAALSADLLDVLTADDEITIGRICASNGSIVLTCRNGEITLSPRRKRPDDQCQSLG